MRRTGVALYGGRKLGYEVINGTVIHDGDIVLGTVEEVVAQHKRSLSREDAMGASPVRRDISPVEDRHLWPNGVIPYVIDPHFNEEGLKSIQAAIDEWNSKTVINLVERTTESDFVRIQLGDGVGGVCMATVGRRDKAGIWVGGPEGCGVADTAHEIGHVVGLWHEHQRVDRDEYVRVPDGRIYGHRTNGFVATGPAGGPYDYASIMHYVGLETIPPGMTMRSSHLSAGDIDGVARLYGKPPTATTISTNPPGLEVEVDGERIATPATFDWSPGSQHVLEAPSPQIVGAQRFVFGRWNDAANARRMVTAGPDSTWFEVNYIVQKRLLACADPPASGEVRIRPESGDDYYALGTPVEIEAVPAAARAFVGWHKYGDEDELSDDDDRSSRSLPGESSNPATGAIWPYESVGSEFVAVFSAEPLFLIDSNVDRTFTLVNDSRKWLPWAFPVDTFPNGIWVQAPAVFPYEGTDPYSDVRYRFDSWSDGGDRIHHVAIPMTGGSITRNVTREYRLRVLTNAWDETAVRISPPSEDGFYPSGTQVVVTAAPSPGEHFAGWTGEVSGPETALTVVMNAPKSLGAVFTRSEPLRPDEEQDVELESKDRFALYSAEEGWHVLVPRDAAEMTVRFQASTAAEVDLYVQGGFEVWSELADDGESPRIHADFESRTQGANETITISRGSTPSLKNDVYYIALGAQPTARRIRGTLSVEIRRSGIARAWPPALTFVSPGGSDPGSRTVWLSHENTSAVRYRIDSDQHWLSASPQEWVQTGLGTTEITLTVNSAGMTNGTHKGELTVVQVAGGSEQGEARSTGIEIPVALAVVPGSRSSSGSRRVNGARITSRPLSGDTYGVGEEIEVAVDLVDPAQVTVNPTLALRVGSQTRQMEWAPQASTGYCVEGYNTLSFRYIVQADDRDADGIDIPENALALDAGALVTANETVAVLAIAPIANAAEHKVDGTTTNPPLVDGLWIDSRPQDGEAYGVGEEIQVQLRFSQIVEVAGDPMLAIGVGRQTRQAEFSHQWEETLWFRYTVQSGDGDGDGISIVADALTLNGGSIRSVIGTDADLDLGIYAIANASEHKVDGGG